MDAIGKDETGKDAMGKDEIGEDEIGEDEIGEDEIGEDEIGEDEIGEDEIGEDDPGEDDPGRNEPDWDELDQLLRLRDDAVDVDEINGSEPRGGDVEGGRRQPSTLNTVLLTLFVTATLLSASAVAYLASSSDGADDQTREPPSSDVVATDVATPSTIPDTTTTVSTTTTTTSTTIPVLAEAIDRDVSGTGIFDAFARVDNDEVGQSAAGDVWFEVSGNWAIEDRSVVLAAPAPAGPSFMVSNMESANGTIQLTMSTVDRSGGMVFRFTDPSNYIAVTAAPEASTWTVVRVEDGTATTVGALGLTDAVDTTTISVRLDAQFMVFSVNGVRSETFLDPDPSPGTLAGLIFGGTDATSARWTNFVAIAEADRDG